MPKSNRSSGREQSLAGDTTGRADIVDQMHSQVLEMKSDLLDAKIAVDQLAALDYRDDLVLRTDLREVNRLISAVGRGRERVLDDLDRAVGHIGASLAQLAELRGQYSDTGD
jgi:hypothetical protein